MTFGGVRSLKHVPEDQGEPGRILINGRKPEAERELRHGDRVICGHAYALKVVIPSKAAEEEEQDHQFDDILREVVAEDEDAVAEIGRVLAHVEEQIGQEKCEA